MKHKRLFSQQLGELMRASRDRQALNLRDTATKIGTYLSGLQRMEEGIVLEVTFKRKKAIADFCGVSLKAFEQILAKAKPPERVTPPQVAKLLADSLTQTTTLAEIRYLAALFRRERWQLPNNPRSLYAILELHRNGAGKAR